MGIAFQLPILVFKRVFSSCAGLRQGLGLLFVFCERFVCCNWDGRKGGGPVCAVVDSYCVTAIEVAMAEESIQDGAPALLPG